jgi:hypothetical protein
LWMLSRDIADEVSACALKEAKGAAGKLIDLREDSDLSVRRAAHAVLKSLAGQD